MATKIFCDICGEETTRTPCRVKGVDVPMAALVKTDKMSQNGVIYLCVLPLWRAQGNDFHGNNGADVCPRCAVVAFPMAKLVAA